MSNTFYNEIINEHNLRPYHKHHIDDPDFTLEGVNPSCGDDIVLNLKMENGAITDGSFEGEGCAISQASADIMLDLVIGKTKEEALRLADIFMRMIKEGITEEEKEELEEAGILESVSHMPARVKCAVLGWRTLKEMLEK
ncbi:MAG: SUF system NifU family Fe-S cluster assembly protein [Lachnospiraceae bacterium]|nr:SUF system NifU family Fe-S cluster assembly protein [Lachnospiraceae bacterium]